LFSIECVQKAVYWSFFFLCAYFSVVDIYSIYTIGFDIFRGHTCGNLDYTVSSRYIMYHDWFSNYQFSLTSPYTIGFDVFRGHICRNLDYTVSSRYIMAIIGSAIISSL